MSADPALADPTTLTPSERDAVETFLFTLADDEFVAAERSIDWQVRGPTLEADVAIANIAQDEYGHARLWYDLLESLGFEETDLLWEREPTAYRHATLLELPFEPGDWADCVLRGYFYDTYEHLLLESLTDTTYAPLGDRVAKVQGEEPYHREHAQNWLERLASDDEGLVRLQRALDRLYPHALTLFAETEREESIVDLGIRPTPIAELRADWIAVTTPFLEGLGLTVPSTSAVDHPTTADGRRVRGRDGTHTDAWEQLYDEFRYTYELLGHEPAKLLAAPEGRDE